MTEIVKNTFYDINKLPKDFGILVFPISINRMHHNSGQTIQECFEYIKYFSPDKVSEPKIGLNVVYSDSLYMNSLEPATTLKKKFMNVILDHKIGFQKLVVKNWERFQIHHAFSYEVWNQLYLDYRGKDFLEDYNTFKKFYKSDQHFQKLLIDDAAYCKRELTPEQENFFLEEHFIMYLITKKRIRLPNEYIQDREKWILWCYPGVMLKGQIYTYQKNPLNLDILENPYQNCTYDLESKKLIDFTRIDLATYNYKYN